MSPTTALEVKRVPHSEDLLHPGEFVFIPKREPVRTFERTPIAPPTGTFRRLWWDLFGKKYELKQIVELLWPEIDTVILNCPECNSPLATTRNHTIVSLEPLTIETPLTCPYCRTNTFKVAEGKIMTA
jgi:uncharacterized protein YbaR (Trm112 family)